MEIQFDHCGEKMAMNLVMVQEHLAAQVLHRLSLSNGMIWGMVVIIRQRSEKKHCHNHIFITRALLDDFIGQLD
jgi:hypothetical protein